MTFQSVSRRRFIQSTTFAAAGFAVRGISSRTPLDIHVRRRPLDQFGYADVSLHSELHNRQLSETNAVLLSLSEDSLLKPFRQMAGLNAPGDNLGGWYNYDPEYNPDTVDVGFAPGCTFGQWVSALARHYAITGSVASREKVLRLTRLYAQAIAAGFFEKHRFPAYTYDKLVCGLIDSHQYVGDRDAFAILQKTTEIALPHLPGKAIEHGQRWRENPSIGYTWDESYTISENLFLASQRGAGRRYLALATQYLDDAYYDPLAAGQNVLAGRHAYSYVNSLSSAMQAYLTVGSLKHFRAARNAFDMLSAQSFATGGWGPEELLRAPETDDVAASLTNTHSSFEAPCGSYAHFKLTRYLLRATGDARYGDSMERVMYNTVLGAKPLLADGSTFYYCDCNFKAHKFYHPNKWACCSGSLPQVAADYGINTYFRDAEGIYVNLYIPSTLRWSHDGARLSLEQHSNYPFDGTVEFKIATTKPVNVAIRLRIPAWAEGARVSVNGSSMPTPVSVGSFSEIRRTWKNGDRIELEWPMRLRVESLDARHPEIVALLRGPLVLCAIGDQLPAATRKQLLAVEQAGPQLWRTQTQSGELRFMPYTAIKDEQYSVYLIAKG
jgi:uncharacterized protein